MLGSLAARRDGTEIVVQPPEQVDQHLLLVPGQARQQPPLALEGRHDHPVVGGAALCRQRDRVGAAVIGIGADRDQSPFFEAGERPAHRALVEADDVADARGWDTGLDRQQRHDPPFRDVDAEFPLIECVRAVRELVGDEGDEGRHVTLEIERRPGLGGRRFSAGSGRGRHIGILSGGVLQDLRVSAALSQDQNEGGFS